MKRCIKIMNEHGEAPEWNIKNKIKIKDRTERERQMLEEMYVKTNMNPDIGAVG
jgi:hypothetical protein